MSTPANPATPAATAPAPAVTDEQKAFAAGVVTIVVDEVKKQTQAHMLDVSKRVAALEERKGNQVPKDLLDNPNGLKRWIETYGADAPLSVGAPVTETRRRFQGIGRAFINSEAYKAYAAKGFSEKQSNIFQFGRAHTAGITSVSDTQAVLSTYLDQDIVGLPQRPIRTRDLFQMVPTKDEQILYIRQTGYTNNAAPVNMLQNDPMTATAAPQSTLTYTKENALVREIAHWIPAPRQLLMDMERLAAEVEQQGNLGVYLEEDTQLISGSGTGQDLPGVLSEANIATFSWSAGDSGDNMADALLQAIVQAWISNYVQDGIVLHPTDWMKIVKLKNTLGDYLLQEQFRKDMAQGGQASINTLMIWGLPTVRTTAISAGTGLTGAFKTAATLYDREEVNVRITDSHADFFLKGIQVMLFEERLALANKRPEAFCKVTFDSAPA